MCHRSSWILSVASAVALVGILAHNPAWPSPEPGGEPKLRLVWGGKIQIDDLWVQDAAMIDDQKMVLVGTKAGAEEDDPNKLEPNGAILDLATKKTRPFTNGHTARICSVAVRRGLIATAGICRDPMVRIWDVKAGKTIHQIGLEEVLKAGGLEREQPWEHTEQAVAWFHKSDTLAVASDDHVVLLNPAKADKPLGVLEVPDPDKNSTDRPITVSPDDAWVACPLVKGPYSEARVVFWQVKTAKPMVVSLVPVEAIEMHNWWVNGVVFGPKNQLFAWREGKSEVKPGTTEAEALKAKRPVVQIGLTDVPKGKCTPLPLGENNLAVQSCAIDPNGQWLALVGFTESNTKVHLYHLPSRKLVCREQIKEDATPVWAAFTPGGKRLVYATHKGDVRWWDLCE